jgi:predicted SAM-dependent methyltransferase
MDTREVRLHLGCGERRLAGYRNIDFGTDQHTVLSPAADEFADITALRYPAASVDEIRLHHVFEHFSRAHAVALLLVWQSWLRPGGILRIEVPDFAASARAALGLTTSRRRQSIALRHIFGSQEAAWADHKTGYTATSLRRLVSRCGFQPGKLRRSAWRGTYNIDLTARRSPTGPPREVWEQVASEYLSQFLLDSSKTETRLSAVWQRHVVEQFTKSGY